MDEKRRIVVFSGTTEGRRLSEQLIASGIPHTVCVATEYGEELQKKSEIIRIEEGRKTGEDMKRLFSQGTEMVVDATHPFATEVTANIRAALEGTGMQYLRVLREKEVEGTGEVRFFDTAEECALACDAVEGNILFTTGSRDLAAMCERITDRERLYVRVLPSVDSIRQCEAAGIRQDHILALQGPFTEEMNLAMLRQYEIRALVTKDSGRTGGVEEKLSACKAAGIPCLCIRRPVAEEGVSVEEAAEEIRRRYGAEKTVAEESAAEGPAVEDTAAKEPSAMVFHLIGTGMGDPEGFTAEAGRIIREADVCFGAERLLETVDCAEKYVGFRADEVLEKTAGLLAAGKKLQHVAVLFSGDIGFYSGASGFEAGLKEKAAAYADRFTPEVHRYPGISCVSALSARLGEAYSDAEILSLHGRCEAKELAKAVKRICRSEKCFVLFSSGDEVARLASALTDAGCEAFVTVGKDLSYPGESIRTYTLKEAETITGKGLYTALIRNTAPVRRKLTPCLEDHEFIRDRVPMTKALIRHESIRMLELHEGDVLYDIGGGTGSVSIEAAGLSDTLSVYAFERKPEAVELFRKNKERFGAENITLIPGEAPEAFSGLPAPDAVFIGGSAGRLQDILDGLLSFRRRIRVVITAITLETMEQLMRLEDHPAVRELCIRQIGCSEAEKMGTVRIMKAQNTVMMTSFILGE